MSAYAEVMRRQSQDPNRVFSTTSPDGWGHIRYRTEWVRVPPHVWQSYQAAAERARKFREDYRAPVKPAPAAIDRTLRGRIARACAAAMKEWRA